MNWEAVPERQRILHQALRARTLPAVAAASWDLETWVAEHPEDRGIVGAFDQLAMVEDALQGEELAVVRFSPPELVSR